LLLALTAGLGMAFALYLQHGLGLEPCPLCVFQRVALIAFAVITLLAALHGPIGWGHQVYAALATLAGVAGIVVAGRHVWLQHLPPEQVPACGPGLDYWMAVFPLQDVIKQVFQGSGECAVIDAAWLGISLPGWTLLLFIALTSATV
jgi:disulfide bond formation protein DsbB